MALSDESAVVRTLRELARDPVDLSKEGVLDRRRLDKMCAQNLGLQLFYGTERVSEKVMRALFALAKEVGAVEKMQALQNGASIDPRGGDERVLHTATRDFFDPSRSSGAIAERSYEELKKLRAFLDLVEKRGITDLIQVGIGGSELGPKAVYCALEAFSKANRRVHFLSNMDPDHAVRTLKKVDLRKTLVVVVSKSGTTLETEVNEAFIRKRFLDRGMSPEHHMMVVTGRRSPLADSEKYGRCFYIEEGVPGRYSTSSMAGCVMLAFALGMEQLLEFLKGANAMDKVALKEDPEENLPLLSALLGVWNRNFLHLPATAIVPYSQAMSAFPAYLQQCDMESNGKRVDRYGHLSEAATGPIVWGDVGTNSQHSFFQFLHQGMIPVSAELIGFRDSQYSEDIEYRETTSQEKLLSHLFAQSIALAVGKKSACPNSEMPGNRPNRILLAKRCTPYSIGSILAYFEHRVVFQGFIWGINSFDQEGVELGKRLADSIIEKFTEKRTGKKRGDRDALSWGYLEKLDAL